MDETPEATRSAAAGWFYSALLLTLFALLFLTPPEGLSPPGYRTLLVAGAAVVLWTSEIPGSQLQAIGHGVCSFV